MLKKFRYNLRISTERFWQDLVALVIALVSTTIGVMQYHNELAQMKIMGLRAQHINLIVNLVDQWNFFQAKNTRAVATGIAAELVVTKKSQYIESSIRYNQEKQHLKEQALRLESLIETTSNDIKKTVEDRSRLLLLSVMLQIAIGIASIALLIRQRWIYMVIVIYSSSVMIASIINIIVIRCY